VQAVSGVILTLASKCSQVSTEPRGGGVEPAHRPVWHLDDSFGPFLTVVTTSLMRTWAVPKAVVRTELSTKAVTTASDTAQVLISEVVAATKNDQN
jgi:hypothetical protein